MEDTEDECCTRISLAPEYLPKADSDGDFGYTFLWRVSHALRLTARRPVHAVFCVSLCIMLVCLSRMNLPVGKGWERPPHFAAHTPGTDVGGFVLRERPAVAMLFLMRRQLSANTIWERWYRDAFDWIYAQGLEDPNVTSMENSTILRTYIHYSPAFSPEAVAEFLPPMLKHALISAPAECQWGDLNTCQYRLYLEAYTKFSEAEYFILVSHNSMPLKPFHYIYQALQNDRRIRTTLIALNFAQGLPKTSMWRGEPREVVEARLWDVSWLPNKWLHIWRLSCAPDECWTWRPLIAQYGSESLQKFAFSENCPDDFSCFMFDCWHQMKACSNTGAIKEGTNPFLWTWLNENFLLRRLNDPDNWFMRKVTDDTLVGDSKELLMDYVGRYFNSSHLNVTAPSHPYAHEDIPTFHEGTIYDLRKAYQQQGVYGLRPSLKSTVTRLQGS